jgi:GxxExxY protein
MLHKDLTERILGEFFQVHYELGFGYVESIYSAAMACVFVASGLRFEREVPIAVHFRGTRIGSFRADLVVEKRVLVEIKCTAQLHPGAEAQVLNYLRSTELEVGLLLHFGPKPEFRRLVYSNARKLMR